jgi:electron transfer flavoprotein alpha subunit
VIAVLPVRAGTLPLGGDEAVAEAGGVALVVGDGAEQAAAALAGVATEVRWSEQSAFRPGRWADAVAPLVDGDDLVVLPASPDGRDLAPRLARVLDRPLLAGAVRIRSDLVTLTRWGGQIMEDVVLAGPAVATLQPGVRGADRDPSLALRAAAVTLAGTGDADGPGTDATEPVLLEVLPADPATMDLAEAERICAGGAGLGAAEVMDALGRVAGAIGCSVGATRVVTDWGWVPFERQIGTTGVTVHPKLYLALGISGAVQHVAGLGHPDHVVAVNTDASCPMMSIADLALVTDAPALVRAVAARLGVNGHA